MVVVALMLGIVLKEIYQIFQLEEDFIIRIIIIKLLLQQT